jgi:NADH:ubiquinone reductase (H+-translocating)
MKTKKQKIVIVGAGFGGLKAALDLSHRPEIDVVLVSENEEFRYYPSLYRTATGAGTEVSSIPLLEIIDPKAARFIKAKVTGLDRAQKHIKTADGQEIAYDYLVLALGVVTNYFKIPGLQERSYGIKSLEDAEELKKHLHRQIIDEHKPDIHYVVIGGGPTGVELAGALGEYVNYICKQHDIRKRSIHVDLVEASPRLLARSSRRISRRVAKQLRNKGVRLYLKSRVEGQTADELKVNGKSIRSHTVIWTAGVTNSPFFSKQNFQLSRSGKVRVDQYLQAEPSIFVIGDNADTPYSGMAQTAIHDGEYVARSLIDIVINERTPDPYVAKRPIYVFPAGPGWAAVQWGRFRLYGRIGWALRRAADFMGYRDYEPFFKATKRWLSDYERDDLCPVCQPYAEVVKSGVVNNY